MPRGVRAKKTSGQLNREIASSLSAQGQPSLAAMFADPEARKVFAQEMRFELQKQAASQRNAEARAARPFNVKRMELVGDRRTRALLGRFATEQEARTQADRVGGWVEMHDGRVIYGAERVP